MKVVILAGGRGTRIAEESVTRPKPMVDIGGRPILWHIMKLYSHYGYNDFIICLGYKGYMIKDYFANYYLLSSDVTFDFRAKNHMTIHSNTAEPWRVTLAETGLNAQTGSRIKQVQKYIGNERFFLTYGDGVSDVNLPKLLAYHEASPQSIVTMTAIQPGGRFGVLDLERSGTVTRFVEKSVENGGWINAGFMVAEPALFDYLSTEELCILEREPLERIAHEGKLRAYKHSGYWQCMDTMRDKIRLDTLWKSGHAPWRVWNDEV